MKKYIYSLQVCELSEINPPPPGQHLGRAGRGKPDKARKTDGVQKAFFPEKNAKRYRNRAPTHTVRRF